MVWGLVCASCHSSLTSYGADCFLISHSLWLASLKGWVLINRGFFFPQPVLCSFRSIATIPATLFCYSCCGVIWPMLARPLLGLLCMPLPMTQCGHWIYTHATLGFLITLLLDSFVPFISSWASLAYFLILHSHELLLTPLGFPDLIILYFIVGAHELSINPLLSLLALLRVCCGSFSLFYITYCPWVYYFSLRTPLSPFAFLKAHLFTLWTYDPLFLPLEFNGFFLSIH